MMQPDQPQVTYYSKDLSDFIGAVTSVTAGAGLPINQLPT